jgi:hypothetical protein
MDLFPLISTLSLNDVPHFNDKFLKSMNVQQLTDITFKSPSTDLTASCIGYLANNCVKLKAIRFSFEREGMDSLSLKLLIERNPNLSVIELDQSCSIDPENCTLSTFGALKYLKSVSVCFNDFLNPKELSHFLQQTQVSLQSCCFIGMNHRTQNSFISMNFSSDETSGRIRGEVYCRSDDIEVNSFLTQLFSEITIIDEIRFSGMCQLSDIVFDTINKHLLGLKRFILNDCVFDPAFNSNSLKKIVRNSQQLTLFYLLSCILPTDLNNDITSLFIIPNNITDLNLTEENYLIVTKTNTVLTILKNNLQLEKFVTHRGQVGKNTVKREIKKCGHKVQFEFSRQ